MNMTCPMCLAGKTSTHPGHTWDEGCRVPRMKETTQPGEEPSRELDRVPRVAESKDHVGKIPPRAPEPDSADAEPAPAAEPAAERLTGGSSSSTAPRPIPRKAADEQTRERVYARRDKRSSDRVPGPTETGEGTENQEWTLFDVGHALKLLHSRDPAVVRRTLRNLHVRFWHAPAKRLSELLQHAGAPADAIKEVNGIVDSCRVCRMWTRPGPRSMTITRLATGMNQMVQWLSLIHI